MMNIMNRSLLLTISTSAAVALSVSDQANGQELKTRPNIVWLVLEDTTAFELGCYGNKDIKTPNMDALAGRGVLFTNASSCGPVCSPARSTLISGSPATTYATGRHREPRLVPTEQYFSPKLLRDAGYFCTNNAKTDYNIDKSQWKTEKNKVWDASNGHATFNHSKRKKGQPFFAIYNHMFPHSGRIATIVTNMRKDRKIDPKTITLPPYMPDIPEVRDDLAWHYESLERVDKWVGNFLKRLKEQGYADDTIIFLFGDNGGPVPRGKAFIYDVGTRVPFIACFPKKWAHLSKIPMSSVSNRLVGFDDFAPTVLSLAGIKIPKYMHGTAFFGSQEKPPKKYQFDFLCNNNACYNPSRAASDGRFRYIRNYTPYIPCGIIYQYHYKYPFYRAWWSAFKNGKCDAFQSEFFQPRPSEQLFDLKNDPWEMRNLASNTKYAAKLAELRKATLDWIEKTRDLGFFPLQLRYQGRNESLYEWVLKTNYPLNALQESANIASESKPENTDKLLEYLSSDRPEIRFWGAAGFATLAQRKLISAVPGKLQSTLNDTVPVVAVTAAEALCYLGKTEIALPLLIKLARQGKPEPFAVLQSLAMQNIGIELMKKNKAVFEKIIGKKKKNKGLVFRARAVLVAIGILPMNKLYGQGDINEMLKIYNKKHHTLDRLNLP
jgi:N-sulfoglucosamine sulfohydrolase